MEKAKNELTGFNEFKLCHNEAKKAFELYFEQLMPTTEVTITSLEEKDNWFIIKTKGGD